MSFTKKVVEHDIAQGPSFNEVNWKKGTYANKPPLGPLKDLVASSWAYPE